MFPTTIWSTIKQAGERDREALERFAAKYRPVVREFVQRRGFADGDTEDICQDVFVRLLSREVLSKADPQRGRFRGLLFTVTNHVIADHFRRRREIPTAQLVADASQARDEDFDRAWVLHLSQLAMSRLESDGSPYFEILRNHLAGQSQDRNKLWIARRKLIALIRNEIALTCSSHREFEDEVAYLSRFLRPRKKNEQKD